MTIKISDFFADDLKEYSRIGLEEVENRNKDGETTDKKVVGKSDYRGWLLGGAIIGTFFVVIPGIIFGIFCYRHHKTIMEDNEAIINKFKELVKSDLVKRPKENNESEDNKKLSDAEAEELVKNLRSKNKLTVGDFVECFKNSLIDIEATLSKAIDKENAKLVEAILKVNKDITDPKKKLDENKLKEHLINVVADGKDEIKNFFEKYSGIKLEDIAFKSLEKCVVDNKQLIMGQILEVYLGNNREKALNKDNYEKLINKAINSNKDPRIVQSLVNYAALDEIKYSNEVYKKLFKYDMELWKNAEVDEVVNIIKHLPKNEKAITQEEYFKYAKSDLENNSGICLNRLLNNMSKNKVTFSSEQCVELLQLGINENLSSTILSYILQNIIKHLPKNEKAITQEEYFKYAKSDLENNTGKCMHKLLNNMSKNKVTFSSKQCVELLKLGISRNLFSTIRSCILRYMKDNSLRFDDNAYEELVELVREQNAVLTKDEESDKNGFLEELKKFL